MSTNGIGFGQADLSSCDREPIHIPGSIQPHGVLLVVDRQDLAILQFAGDVRFLLGAEPERMARLTLFSLFEEKVLTLITARLSGTSASTLPSLLLGLSSRSGAFPLDATVHVQGGLGVIELEPARRSATLAGDPLAQVKSMLAELQSGAHLADFLQLTTIQIRQAIGFDRVMVYRFLHDGSGQVVAEDRATTVDSFLNLHYPASDVPQQARELYRRNWLRLIPDVHYTPTPLSPAAASQVNVPLDMSHCCLRSVSPIHLEYLRNMGVTASMSVSIVIGDTLWGLIACHNYAPRYVPADLRVSCELFAQILSLQLESRIEMERSERRLAARAAIEDLNARLVQSRDVLAALIGPATTLLELIPSGGVAICLDGRVYTLGDTPTLGFINELVTWLRGLGEPVFQSFTLGAVFPPGETQCERASGVLAVALSREADDCVIWFRPEVARTVNWAGDPDKPVEVGPLGDRLTPRKSFEVWQQQVRQQSTPWDAVEIETAHAFRMALLELHQVELAERERKAAFARQNLLMAELDHRVKNTLANIQALVRQTREGATSLESFTQTLAQRIRAMSHAHDLMASARWQGATVRKLLQEELAPFRSASGTNIRMSGDDHLMLLPKAAMPFTLVVHELTTNAAKYGALSTAMGYIDIHWERTGPAGPLGIQWRECNGPAAAAPMRRGFGSTLIERSLSQEIDGNCTLTFAPDGVCCVMSIPAEHLMVQENGDDGPA
jgi:light-regulated signal transduction histidine kinase (bacteriophytochrome)